MKKRLIPFAVIALAAGMFATSCGGSSTSTTWTWKDAIADGKLGYVVLYGEDGNPESADRTQGCEDAMAEIATTGGFKATKIAQKTCIDSNGNAWSDQAAKETVEQWVTQYGSKLDFIVSNNDGMAIAAAGVSTLKKGTPIIGFDALSSACDMIKAGTLAGSVSQSGDDQALLAVNILSNLLKGTTDYSKVTTGYNGHAEINDTEASKHIIQAKLQAVTKSNADSLKPGQYVTVSEDSEVKGKKMLVATYSNNDNFIKETYRSALPYYAQAMGYEVTVVEGDGSDDAALQNLIKAEVNKTTYDAFAFNIITHANYQAYLNIAGDKPVVFFNRQPKTSDNESVADISGLEKVYYVGSSSTGQGTAQGQIIKDWYSALEK